MVPSLTSCVTAAALDQAGATVLTGLTGNVAIPRQSLVLLPLTGLLSLAAPTESQPDRGPSDDDAPHRRCITTDYSRRLLIQSSIDVENMIRRDLASRSGTQD